MARTTTGNEDTVLAAEVLHPINFAKLEFPGGTIRVSTHNAPLNWDDGDGAVDYTGLGDFGGISKIEETIEGKTDRVTLTLSGVKSSLVALALASGWRWQPGTIYKGWLNVSTNVLVETPRIRFRGWMDSMPFDLGTSDPPKPATINVSIVSRFARWEAPFDVPRWSNNDHQKRRPGDKFFEFMAEIAKGQEIFWGQSG